MITTKVTCQSVYEIQYSRTIDDLGVLVCFTVRPEQLSGLKDLDYVPGVCTVPAYYSKGVARGGGGSWGARDPPFVSLFLSKQPTIFGGGNAMTILFDPV